MPLHCPRCGVVIPDDKISCVNCGYLEDIIAPEVVKARVKAERKVYAGFWKRLAAGVLDVIILTMAEVLILGFMVGMLLVGNCFLQGKLNQTTIGGFCAGFGLILALVLNWSYFTFLESSFRQATYGKMVMGIKVTDLEKRRITFGRANMRFWFRIISALSLMIGIIIIAFTKKKQGFHDLIADTMVVMTNKGVTGNR